MEKILCKGFRAAGLIAGIKKNGRKDLGLIYSEVPASVAGVFTRNLVKAAPVLLDMERVKTGKCQAIVANSGNANCCSGPQGMEAAIATTRFAGKALGISEEQVCVCSTGVIGQPLPVSKVEAAMPKLAEALRPDGFGDFAEAILTTDLIPKVVRVSAELDGKPFSVVGVAKGSGMIRPDMATMLCFVCTDLKAEPEILHKALVPATDWSFNRITVDGDTSTNDTILLMANGLSGAEIKTQEHLDFFEQLLEDMLLQLAKMVVKDGEGATKLVEIIVQGAASDKDARIVADTIAHSPLVKTALFGEDANWGRIIGAVGRAGVPVNPDTIDILFNNVTMCRNSMGCGPEAEAEATKILKTPEFAITVDLNMGKGQGSVFTCDFSIDYVKINADYRS